MVRRVVPVLAVVLAAGLIAGCGTSKSTSAATVTACNADPNGGQPTAQGSVLNDSSKKSTFVLRIGFYDSSGNKVSQGVVNIGDVEPGTSGNWSTTGVTSAKGPLTCKVTSLNRTSIIQD